MPSFVTGAPPERVVVELTLGAPETVTVCPAGIVPDSLQAAVRVNCPVPALSINEAPLKATALPFSLSPDCAHVALVSEIEPSLVTVPSFTSLPVALVSTSLPVASTLMVPSALFVVVVPLSWSS